MSKQRNLIVVMRKVVFGTLRTPGLLCYDILVRDGKRDNYSSKISLFGRGDSLSKHHHHHDAQHNLTQHSLEALPISQVVAQKALKHNLSYEFYYIPENSILN